MTDRLVARVERQSPPPIVELTWVDSMILDDGGWVDVEDSDGYLHPEGLQHRTCGYLVAESGDAVVIAGSINDGETRPNRGTRACAVLVIPRVAIVEGPVRVRPC